MASSGTINNTFRTGYAIRIVWSVGSQSVANNTSSVTASVQLVSLGSSYTINSSATKNGTLTINGTAYSFTFSAALAGNQVKTIHTRTVTVAHNADGGKTCAFSCSAGIAVTLGGTYYTNVTASGNGVFNTIARATIPTLSASTFAMGSTITINTPRASSGFTHTLTYVFGNQSGAIASNVGTSTTWAVPLGIAVAIPNGTTGYGSIVCQTYSGSTLIGTMYANFTATVPASVVPSISSVSISEAVSGLAAQFQGYVQNKSRLAVSVSASGVYYSRITAYRTTILGVAYTAASFTSGLLTTSGNVTVSITVTDSRGRTATTTRTVNVMAYTPPSITVFSGFRSNTNGTENYEGTSVYCRYVSNIASVGSRNTNRYVFQYKLKSASTWTNLTSGNSYTLNSNRVFSNVASPDSSFDFRLEISDFFTTISSTFEIPTGFTLIDYNSNGRGLAFGKVSEQSAFESALKILALNGFRIGLTDVVEPSAITVNLGGTNFRKTKADYEILPMTSATSYGRKLTLTNNQIVIGQGVSKIRVCGQICYGAATAGLKVCAIFTSASASHIARVQNNITNASIPESLCMPPCIYNVAAGQTITLRVYGTTNDIIYGGYMQTYLTIEVVA